MTVVRTAPRSTSGFSPLIRTPKRVLQMAEQNVPQTALAINLCLVSLVRSGPIHPPNGGQVR